MINIRKHYFPASDNYVVTGVCPNGQYRAELADEDKIKRLTPRGYGHTRLAAIADLNEMLREWEE